jgi:hypothetical protein
VSEVTTVVADAKSLLAEVEAKAAALYSTAKANLVPGVAGLIAGRLLPSLATAADHLIAAVKALV